MMCDARFILTEHNVGDLAYDLRSWLSLVSSM